MSHRNSGGKVFYRAAKAATTPPQPPHLYLDNTWYIITASTYHHAHYLTSDQAKILVRDKLKTLIQ